MKDDKPVKSDVTSTEEMPNGDWYYQIHSHLEYTPKSGEKISCMVDHAGLTKPIIVDWGERKDSSYVNDDDTFWQTKLWLNKNM